MGWYRECWGSPSGSPSDRNTRRTPPWAPPWTPRWTPRTLAVPPHFLFENRSLVDVQIRNGHLRRRVGGILFENRSLVDFLIGSEHEVIHGVHFVFENQSMVDFQIRNEQDIVDGVHFLFENRSMIDFRIGTWVVHREMAQLMKIITNCRWVNMGVDRWVDGWVDRGSLRNMTTTPPASLHPYYSIAGITFMCLAFTKKNHKTIWPHPPLSTTFLNPHPSKSFGTEGLNIL